MTTLQPAEIDQAVQCFAQAREHVRNVTTGLSEAQWRFKTAPDRWCIAEILEHMVLTQERVFGRVTNLLSQSPAPPPDRDHSQIDRVVLEKLPDRSIKAKAPEFIEPTGQLNPADAFERMDTNYRRLTEYVQSTPGLREHILDAPPLRIVTEGAYTTMDGYQWALTVARHDERHVQQIMEVKQHPDFPRQAAAAH
jgi:DinB family protein